MAKPKTTHTCSFCGYQSPKWLGKCPDCDQWNTFYEEISSNRSHTRGSPAASLNTPVSIRAIPTDDADRVVIGIREFDRVLGGGLVRGAVILIGGDPGIGKSTIMLQALSLLAERGLPTLYVSGEESLRQVRMRAERLGALPDNLSVLAETSLEQIKAQILERSPAILAIDSVQTVYSSDLESAPGSVSQIRECSGALISLAKQHDTSTFLVGHVTKEGAIAGPRVLEHMVDTVLYFEGDRGHTYRILRAVKNRFGSTDEIGVFEMGPGGLREVLSPSELFLAERPAAAPGSTVVPSIEGTRPILVEIQALTTPSVLAMPRRTAIGFDHSRASVLVAVLEKKTGITLYNQDIFINIAGGIRLSEPGVDLGVITSIVSSARDVPLPPHTCVCGEVGLTGEVRAVSQIASRVNEAQRLGFSTCLVPKNNLKNSSFPGPMRVIGVETIQDAISCLFNL
jgi:DNA repair protein RadA/Sms